MKHVLEPAFRDEQHGRYVARIRDSQALQKLNEMARDLAGLFLVVLVRINDRMVELHPAGGDGDLPPFCQVYRSSPLGEKRCRTCRSLVAFGACYRGPIEYACHGGVSVVAAPAVRRDGTRSERVVVASCSFAQHSRERGWSLAKKHANGLGLDLRRLKRAYFELPMVSEERRRIARGITGAAAALLGEFEDQAGTDLDDNSKASNTQDLDSQLSRIGLTRDPSHKPEGGSVGSILVDHVIAMVKRDPSMPYHVSNVARAAHVTPNYFSALFAKHTGQTFSKFLSEQRVLYACDILRDIRLTVGEVAHRAGFRDSAYFSRRFKEVMGIAPSAWRAQIPDSEFDQIPLD
jgi:AraC-like DNA-binding protein